MVLASGAHALNGRMWLRVGLGILIPSLLVLEVATIATTRYGLSAFFWPVVFIITVGILVPAVTALVHLIRFRFQFSLRALLVAFADVPLILSVILAIFHPIERYRRARLLGSSTSYYSNLIAPEWLKGRSATRASSS